MIVAWVALVIAVLAFAVALGASLKATRLENDFLELTAVDHFPDLRRPAPPS